MQLLAACVRDLDTSVLCCANAEQKKVPASESLPSRFPEI